MEPKGYTTKEDIENYTLTEIDESFDAQLDSYIAGIEKIIDQITGRNFVADEEASARLFDGDGTQELLVDDCIAVDTVEVGNDSYGGTFTEVEDSGPTRFFLDPANYEAKSVPIHKITLAARCWPCGKQNNKITANWGYSENAPQDIKFAATVFVAGILNQNRQGGDEIKSERIGNYTVTYNTDKEGNSWADFTHAMSILESYKKLNI